MTMTKTKVLKAMRRLKAGQHRNTPYSSTIEQCAQMLDSAPEYDQTYESAVKILKDRGVTVLHE